MKIKDLIKYLKTIPADTTVKILSADTGFDPVSNFIDIDINNTDHVDYSSDEQILYIGDDRYNS